MAHASTGPPGAAVPRGPAAATAAAAEPVATERWRVVKTLQPLQPGTLKLLERYGEALVCVRYREDHERTTRLTTIELIVDRRAARSTRLDRQWVELRIEWRESTLRQRAKALGAVLDTQTALWRMPYRAARILGLTHRIIDPTSPHQ